MKFLVFLLVAVAWASADVSHIANDERYAPVVRNDYEISPEGAYRYVYETGNGIFGRAAAVVANPNTDHESLSVSGDYRYPSPNGPVELNYVADENGFQPQGAHLPVAPPTPEAILRSLAYIAAHPPQPQEPGRRF